jgi:hypothetical protein
MTTIVCCVIVIILITILDIFKHQNHEIAKLTNFKIVEVVKIDSSNEDFSITFETDDYSVSDADGRKQAQFYNQYPILNTESVIADTINSIIQSKREEFFDIYYDRFLENLDLVKENDPYLIEHPYYCKVSSEIAYQDSSFISFKFTDNWYQGSVSNTNYYGLTFNLETGNIVYLGDLYDTSETEIKQMIMDASMEYFPDDIGLDSFNGEETFNNYEINDYRFYMTNSNVIICYDTYELTSGAGGPILISIPLPSSSISRKKGKVPVAVNNRKIAKLPNLPKVITDINEIVPNGWSLLDSLEHDFNGDGLKDLIGTLDHPINHRVMRPRLLFIYLNNGNGYSLNLENPYLIRNRDEGGIFGDPYQEITASKNTFTINAYGGSAWRWSEYETFELKNERWFLLSNKHSYGYGGFETSYEFNDFTNEIGFRRVTEESPEKENPESLTYYVQLDQQQSLEDYAYFSYHSGERIQAQEIKTIEYNSGIENFEGEYPKLSESNILARNEKYIVYRISQSEDTVFIGVYTFADKNLQMIARYYITEQSEEDFPGYVAKIYKDRLYYTEDISKVVSVRKDDIILKQREIVAVQLISMKLDGSDKQVIIKADHPEYDEDGIIQNYLSYFSLFYEITGNEIIMHLHGGDNELYYKMNLIGEDLSFIGSLPRGDW